MKRRLINLLVVVLGERRVFEIALVWRRVRRILGLVRYSSEAPAPMSEAPPIRLREMPLTDALITARALPGSLTDAELRQLYDLGRGGRAASWHGLVEEGRQAAVMLMAGGASGATLSLPRSMSQADLIVAQSGFTLPPASLQSKTTAIDLVSLAGMPAQAIRRGRLGAALAARARLRVVIVNDVGFQYGAGAATRRQAQSFMLGGWDVGLVCWDAGINMAYPGISGFQLSGRWLGARNLPDLHPSFGLTDSEITTRVVAAIRELEPDFVLVGNLHGGSWPIDIIPALRDEGFPTAAYMHDLHWVTGRCAYPGGCDAYHAGGCHAGCPTADQYPRLPRDQIAEAWRHRADVFTGPDATPLIANSEWTRAVALSRFGDQARVEVVHLGLDTRLFAPMDRMAARALLGIDFEGPMVAIGSVNVKEERKGGPIMASLLGMLAARPDIGVIAFGHNSQELPCTKAFGGVTDERMMALIFNAADVLVGTAREEAFGQTLIEASSMGLPVVAFAVGGALEAMVPGRTAMAVETFSAEAIMAALDQLLADPDRMSAMGSAGRAYVAERFTLATQLDGWRATLSKLWPG